MTRNVIKQKIKDCLKKFDGIDSPDDKVSETLFNVYGEEMNEICRMFESEFRNLKSESSNKWISINDRMPEPTSIVLIWTTISLEPTLGYYCVHDWFYYSANGNFWISDEPHIKVLYWKKLDIPPQVIKSIHGKEQVD